VTDLVTVTGEPNCTLEITELVQSLTLDKVTGSGLVVMLFILIKLCGVSSGERSPNLSSDSCS